MDEEQADTEEDDHMTIAGMNILLAEDNELMLEVVRDLLEERGAVITAAGNGSSRIPTRERPKNTTNSCTSRGVPRKIHI